jgi:hypothetical protein
MEQVSRPSKVKAFRPNRDALLDFGNSGQVQVLPTLLLEQVSDEIIDVEALHNDDDRVGDFIIQAGQKRIAVPPFDLLSRGLGVGVLRFHGIVDDDEVSATPGEGAFRRRCKPVAARGSLEFNFGVFAG